MSRLQLYSDRVQIVRILDYVNQGEEISGEPLPVGDWIPCILRQPRGAADALEVRTSVPESAVLIAHVRDDSGDPVTFLQGDRLNVRFNKNGVLVQRASEFRIMGNIVETRDKRRIVSWQLEVQRESEHS